MRNALYVEGEIIFSSYLRLFWTAGQKNLETSVLKLGKARRHLNFRQNVMCIPSQFFL
jgi:hypothetical protein